MKKKTLSAWQITFPLCVVCLAVLGLLTAIHLTDGRYRFRLSATQDGISIETDVDKRDNLEDAKRTKDEFATDTES